MIELAKPLCERFLGSSMAELDLQKLRKDYRLKSLDEKDVARNPYDQFTLWVSEAVASDLIEPNAFALATASKTSHAPSLRMVLMKEFDQDGIVFYTNYQSKKAADIASNQRVAALFYWEELERQVRIEGLIAKVSRQQSEQYFHQRPRSAQIGAHASAQSAVIPGRSLLEQTFQRLDSEWSGKGIECPTTWGGYRITPDCYEFWQGRESRLHDRIQYRKSQNSWIIERLSP